MESYWLLKLLRLGMGTLEISNHRNSRNLIFLFNFLQIKNITIGLLKILIIDLLRI